MDVVIVGHGPSLLSARQGERIDSFDKVIRQKRCQETLKYPEQYGTRKDVVCGSWTIRAELWKVGTPEIWVFMDSRHEKVPEVEVQAAQRQGWRVNRGLCNEWNGRYRNRRTAYTRPEGMAEFDPLGHPHLSAGFHALLYACHFLKPRSVTLAGFDNVETGRFTWSITRGPEWSQYPDHRWDIEHEMLQDVQNEWDVEVKFL